MHKVDMLVSAPHFFTMEGNGVGYKNNTVMVIKDGKIYDFVDAETARSTFTAIQNLSLDHHAIFPGFIDAHMHTSICIVRGLAQDTNNWMMYGLQPFDNVIKPEHKDAGSKLGIIEGVMSGTTTFGDFEQGMDGVCSFVEKIGVRGNITELVREAKRRVYNPGQTIILTPFCAANAASSSLASVKWTAINVSSKYPMLDSHAIGR